MEPIHRFSLEDYTEPGKPIVLCRLESLEEAERALRQHQQLLPTQRYRISFTSGFRKINKYYPNPATRQDLPTPSASP